MINKVKNTQISRLTASTSSFVNVFEGSSSLISSSTFKEYKKIKVTERERERDAKKSDQIKRYLMINCLILYQMI